MEVHLSQFHFNDHKFHIYMEFVVIKVELGEVYLHFLWFSFISNILSLL